MNFGLAFGGADEEGSVGGLVSLFLVYEGWVVGTPLFEIERGTKAKSDMRESRK